MSKKIVSNPSGYHSRGRTLTEKASNFASFIKQHDWTGKWTQHQETGDVKLFARRGENETIEIEWFNGGGGIVEYILAGERIKCRNVSAAALIAQRQPDPSRLKKAVRKKSRSLGLEPKGEYVAPEVLEGITGSLPFDHESTDEEIKMALVKRDISWVNRMNGQLHSGTVGAKQFSIVRNGHDYISFADKFGFHSVYINSIVSVG